MEKTQKKVLWIGIAVVLFLGVVLVVSYQYGKSLNMASIQNAPQIQEKSTLPLVDSSGKSTSSSVNKSVSEISNKWVLVSHGNFWSNPNFFANRNYKFPNITFSYPDNWKFQCCGDTGNSSEHLIFSSENRDMSLPYIRITDHVLSGCSDAQKSCSLDKAVKVTADEKFRQLVSFVPEEDILPKLRLEKLNTVAFVYNKHEKNNTLSKGYIINLGNDVVGIDFINYELLSDTFIENFLNRIAFEIK